MLLQCEQVTRCYDRDGKNIYTAVNQADFCMEASDLACIIGKSGSGKSTLLNMIAGLLRPSSGTVILDSDNLWAMEEKQMAYIRNSKIGYIPQGMSLLGNLTAEENVRLPYCLYKREGDGGERAEMLLEKVGLKNRIRSYPYELSGGEMKRVAIARALMNQPLLLIADEPTSDIDEETTRGIMQLFCEICSEGTAILMATHDLDNIKWGNRVFRMSGGIFHESNQETLQ